MTRLDLEGIALTLDAARAGGSTGLSLNVGPPGGGPAFLVSRVNF
jgi:hypothetical protein